MGGPPKETNSDAAPTPIRLRALVADEEPAPLRKMAEVARGLGHDVVALEMAASGVSLAIREHAPEVAIVVLHRDVDHALDLIAEIVDERVCPVIVQSSGDDPEFAARAAARGVYAFSAPIEAEALQTAIEVGVRRFEEIEELSEEVENLEGAIRRRAIVERAKGMLMERQGIDEREAFEQLRSRARSSNRTLVDIAQRVLDGEPLAPDRHRG
jgi:response regulator NasT